MRLSESLLMLQIEYLYKQWFDTRRVDVQVNADDLVVQPVQLGNLLYQLKKRRFGLATWINTLQVSSEQIVI